MYSTLMMLNHTMTCWKVAKRVNFKGSFTRKRSFVNIYGDNCQLDLLGGGNPFAMYTNIKSLWCTPETNRSYMSIIPQ